MFLSVFELLVCLQFRYLKVLGLNIANASTRRINPLTLKSINFRFNCFSKLPVNRFFLLAHKLALLQLFGANRKHQIYSARPVELPKDSIKTQIKCPQCKQPFSFGELRWFNYLILRCVCWHDFIQFTCKRQTNFVQIRLLFRQETFLICCHFLKSRTHFNIPRLLCQFDRFLIRISYQETSIKKLDQKVVLICCLSTWESQVSPSIRTIIKTWWIVNDDQTGCSSIALQISDASHLGRDPNSAVLLVQILVFQVSTHSSTMRSIRQYANNTKMLSMQSSFECLKVNPPKPNNQTKKFKLPVLEVWAWICSNLVWFFMPNDLWCLGG